MTRPDVGSPSNAGELELLREMGRHLVRRSHQFGRAVPDHLTGVDSLDGLFLCEFEAAIRKLVGDPLFEDQKACGLEHPHERNGVCTRCGYSDNLYLNTLESLLQRRRSRS